MIQHPFTMEKTITRRAILTDLNTWYQIHTNGASTTFARIYKATDDNGATLWSFEKLATDYVNSIAESFGQEYFPTEGEAHERLIAAIDSGI